MCSNTLRKRFHLLKLFGVFSNPEQLYIFLVAQKKKKVSAVESFSHKVGPNCPIRQADTTLRQAVKIYNRYLHSTTKETPKVVLQCGEKVPNNDAVLQSIWIGKAVVPATFCFLKP